MLSVSLLHNNYKGNGTRAVNYNNYPWFQSTFPQGERHQETRYFLKTQFISIHVPTRGTTDLRLITFDRSVNFNPRSHKGNDHCPVFQYCECSWFQSTFPQGERPELDALLDRLKMISIHVPTRGTTLFMVLARGDNGFQSTFPQGERR